jgi:Mo-dependent nitrogenase C-terminus
MNTLTSHESVIPAASGSPLPTKAKLIPVFANSLTFLFNPVRQWLGAIEIRDIEAARAVCQVIPAFCPFAQEIKLFNRTLLSIPPLCKLNPFYDQLMELRFKGLLYLERCGEDITPFCQPQRDFYQK